MPVSLAELTSDHAHAIVTYNGHEIDVEYAPGLVTERTLADMLDMAARGADVAKAPGPTAGNGKRWKGTTDAVAGMRSGYTSLLEFTSALNALIARLVYRWDLTENDGETMYPLVPERLADLPLAFRQAVVEAIFGALRMDPRSGMR